MYNGKLVFAQTLEHLPHHTLRRCIQRYHGNHHVKRFSCQDQYRCMAFAQLTCRESLRDIEACLRAQSNKLYHMGLRSTVSRSTLAAATPPSAIPTHWSRARHSNDRVRVSQLERLDGDSRPRFFQDLTKPPLFA